MVLRTQNDLYCPCRCLEGGKFADLRVCGDALICGNLHVNKVISGDGGIVLKDPCFLETASVYTAQEPEAGTGKITSFYVGNWPWAIIDDVSNNTGGAPGAVLTACGDETRPQHGLCASTTSTYATSPSLQYPYETMSTTRTTGSKSSVVQVDRPKFCQTPGTKFPGMAAAAPTEFIALEQNVTTNCDANIATRRLLFKTSETDATALKPAEIQATGTVATGGLGLALVARSTDAHSVFSAVRGNSDAFVTSKPAVQGDVFVLAEANYYLDAVKNVAVTQGVATGAQSLTDGISIASKGGGGTTISADAAKLTLETTDLGAVGTGFDIEVDADKDVLINSGVGAVTGDVNVQALNDVLLQAGSAGGAVGSITLQAANAAGDIDATAGKDITLTTTAGEVTILAQTNITATATAGDVEISTTDATKHIVLSTTLLGFYDVTPGVAQAAKPAAASGTDSAIIDAIVKILADLGLCQAT